ACRWSRSRSSVTRRTRSARRRSRNQAGTAQTREIVMRSALAALAFAASVLVSPAASAQSAGKDTMLVAFGAESTTLDPIKAAAGVDYYFISQMFENLLRQG